MRKNVIVWLVILLFVVGVSLVSAQVRVPDPTPPNPAPNIPAPAAPRVTPPAPPAPPAPGQADAISPTDQAPANAEKQPAKSALDNNAAGQNTLSHLAIGAIALVMLVFGILIGRMSATTRSKP